MGYLLVEFIQLTVPHKSIPNVNISLLISKQVYKDVTRTTGGNCCFKGNWAFHWSECWFNISRNGS